jgi:hypothetical protein
VRVVIPQCVSTAKHEVPAACCVNSHGAACVASASWRDVLAPSIALQLLAILRAKELEPGLLRLNCAFLELLQLPLLTVYWLRSGCQALAALCCLVSLFSMSLMSWLVTCCDMLMHGAATAPSASSALQLAHGSSTFVVNGLRLWRLHWPVNVVESKRTRWLYITTPEHSPGKQRLSLFGVAGSPCS